MLHIPKADISSYDQINSIDEAYEVYHTLYEGKIYDTEEKLIINPEQEFWAHSSNLQAWAENNYDSRLIHSNLSFPLLKELAKHGDSSIISLFKEEIKKRLPSANSNLLTLFQTEGYIPYYAGMASILKMEDFSREDVAKMLEAGNPLLINYLTEMKFINSLTREEYFRSLLGGRIEKEDQVNCMLQLEKMIDDPLNIILLLDYSMNGFYIYRNEFTALSVSEKNLNVPKCIGSLKNLKKLYLFGNHIENLPDSFTNLQNLEQINLASNNLSTFPSEICKIKSLKTCILCYNKLRSIPDDIKNLRNLEYLDLDGNSITEIPQSIEKLSKLESLKLCDNKIGYLPTELANIESLKHLDVCGNENIAIPKDLEEKKDLKLIALIFFWSFRFYEESKNFYFWNSY